MPLPSLPVHGLDDINHRRRSRETINNILNHQFDDSKVRTSAEISAGVTPVNYAYPLGHLYRYGTNTSPGTTDMASALTSAIAQCVQSGGAPVYIPDRVAIGSSVILLSGASIYGDGPDVSSIYALANTFSLLTDNNSPVTDIVIEDLLFDAVSIGSSNRGVFLDADTSDTSERITIRRCKFTNTFRGVNIHRVAGLVFEDCEGEDLGSSVLYVGLSKAAGRSSNVRIRNVRMEGGDTAPDAAGSGIIFVGYTDVLQIRDTEFIDTGAYSGALTTHHHSIYLRSVTDTLVNKMVSSGQRRGAGLQIFSDVSGSSEDPSERVTLSDILVSGATHYCGLRLDQIDGLTMNNIQVEACYTQACYITNCTNLSATNVIGRNNNQQRLSGTDNAMMWVEEVVSGSFSNITGSDDDAGASEYGQSVLFAFHGDSEDIQLNNCRNSWGGDGAFGYYGFAIVSGATLTRFSVNGFIQIGGSNFFNETGIGTQGMFTNISLTSTGSTTPFNTIQLHKFQVKNVYVAGLSWGYESDGKIVTAHLSAVPTTGTWGRGSKVYLTTPSASSSPGSIVVTAGTFSSATDNTGDTDGSTAVITGMTDTSDFFVGEYVTISAGFASTGPFQILSKTSSSITVNANSNGAQSNVTVSTPDPVFKAMANLAA